MTLRSICIFFSMNSLYLFKIHYVPSFVLIFLQRIFLRLSRCHNTCVRSIHTQHSPWTAWCMKITNQVEAYSFPVPHKTDQSLISISNHKKPLDKTVFKEIFILSIPVYYMFLFLSGVYSRATPLNTAIEIDVTHSVIHTPHDK